MKSVLQYPASTTPPDWRAVPMFSSSVPKEAVVPFVKTIDLDSEDHSLPL